MSEDKGDTLLSSFDEGKTVDEVRDDIKHVAYIRGRYTILDLAHDLGILDRAALKILE